MADTDYDNHNPSGTERVEVTQAARAAERAREYEDPGVREWELEVVTGLARELLKAGTIPRPVASYLRRTLRRSGQRDVADFAAFARRCLTADPARWFLLAWYAASNANEYGYADEDATYLIDFPGEWRERLRDDLTRPDWLAEERIVAQVRRLDGDAEWLDEALQRRAREPPPLPAA